MPSFSKVRLTGRGGGANRRRVAARGGARRTGRRRRPRAAVTAAPTAPPSGCPRPSRRRGTSCVVAPSPAHAFFEQAVLDREVGHNLLQGAGLAAQLLHLVRCRR